MSLVTDFFNKEITKGVREKRGGVGNLQIKCPEIMYRSSLDPDSNLLYVHTEIFTKKM